MLRDRLESMRAFHSLKWLVLLGFVWSQTALAVHHCEHKHRHAHETVEHDSYCSLCVQLDRDAAPANADGIRVSPTPSEALVVVVSVPTQSSTRTCYSARASP